MISSPHRIAKPLLVVALVSACLATAASPALAQKEPKKKIYCWQEGGRKVCGDSLPASATNSARTEISAKTGVTLNEVGRTLTPAEQALADAQAKQIKLAQEAEQARQRRDMAMAMSYPNESALRDAYRERMSVLDEAIKGSQIGEKAIRSSLVTLLDQANALQLNSKTIPQPLLAKIRAQRADLDKQVHILGSQRNERGALDGEMEDALARYRARKQADADAANQVL